MIEYEHGPRLVPDDDEVNHLLAQGEDLLGQITSAEEVTADEDPDPWTLPTPLAGGAATRAVERISDAVREQLTPAHLADARQGPQMYGPDGRYEHTPLRLVKLDQADVDTLAAAVRVCRRALGAHQDEDAEHRRRLDDLREVLEDVDLDSGSWPGGAPLLGEDKLTPLVRLHKLLTLDPDADTAALTEAVTTAGGRDMVLTAAQEAVYQRVASRLNDVLTGGDPLHRWEY